MWDLFYHFLTLVVGVEDVDRIYDDRWENELFLLDKGCRGSELSDNTLAFLSWYQSHWGTFGEWEAELWEDTEVTPLIKNGNLKPYHLQIENELTGEKEVIRI